MKNIKIVLMVAVVSLTACKKEGCTDEKALNYNSKAKKDDGSCTYEKLPLYVVPSTYNFKDANGNNTVIYTGQTERLDQLRQMVVYMKSATNSVVNAVQLKDMFANTNGNANGAFSFTSTKQLKDKCFDLDRALFESWMDSLALASNSFAFSADLNQAGTLTTGSSTYLFSKNGIEYLQLIEKGLMGAVFLNQALNVYFGDGKMDVDNSTAVDPTSALYYTAMEHHWDEAFGYFGVPTDFPTTMATDFWGKYSNSQNASLNSNKIMMDNFLKGRAAISNKVYEDRDIAIKDIKTMWEKISAYQAMSYLQQAVDNFTDVAKRLHVLSEAYAFVMCLRYAPSDTRKMTNTEVTSTLNKFGQNFWNLSIATIQEIKAEIDGKY
jgi:hypothetical protein